MTYYADIDIDFDITSDDVEDKLKNVNELDKDFYTSTYHGVQTVQHSCKLFKRSEYGMGSLTGLIPNKNC